MLYHDTGLECGMASFLFSSLFWVNDQISICSLCTFQTSANEKKRNFVETIEAHVILGVDPRRGDQV